MAHLFSFLDCPQAQHCPKRAMTSCLVPFITLSEETANSTVYHHLNQQSSCIKTHSPDGSTIQPGIPI